MENDQRLWFLRREPLILMTLAALAVVFFTGVVFLSRSYQRQQEKLGRQLYAQGLAQSRLQHFKLAAGYFRAALDYSRDNYVYQLHLVQALAALGNYDECISYLLSLWDQQPEDGTVNLELARIYANKGAGDKAIRYYHNAVYAIWRSNPDVNRRKARLELIEFLLQQNAAAQAQAELLALASDLPDDPGQHREVGDLFLRVMDYEHALEQYRYVLRTQRKDEAALTGAGRAAFELGRYTEAQHYLNAALAVNPKNQDAGQLLRTSALVLSSDPFARRLTDAERSRRVLRAFDTAGARLKACVSPPPASPPPGASGNQLVSLLANWSSLKPKMTAAVLRRTPQLRDSAMDLIFNIEEAAENSCGPASGEDLALLLISQDRERTER
jgi:tetratricopeptide (TPR) repeat protein